MASCQSVCLRRLAAGARRGIVGFGRFLANGRVTVTTLIAGWGRATSAASAGRHVLAIQDTSEINFTTHKGRRRGLGEIGKGSGRGVLLHAMIGVDAGTGGLLGLVWGRIWTRRRRVRVHHNKRLLKHKESERWVVAAQKAGVILAGAETVTNISDREGDFYVAWSRVHGQKVHLLARAMKDRPTLGGGKLSTARLIPAGEAEVELRARPGRAARKARLVVGYGQVTLKKPAYLREKGLLSQVTLTLVEVVETGAPKGATPVLWRLLTTHRVLDAAMAWRVVGWYRERWTIEQFFRTLKQQGLQLEESQLETAERLIKLTAIAARAAVLVMQLVQARDGSTGQAAEIAFTPAEIDALEALVPRLEGKTALQKNPHPARSLAWAAWAIGKLGGWDGYPRSKPPGPITMRHGLQRFLAIAEGWSLRDV
jgi:hypothetical protein